MSKLSTLNNWSAKSQEYDYISYLRNMKTRDFRITLTRNKIFE